MEEDGGVGGGVVAGLGCIGVDEVNAVGGEGFGGELVKARGGEIEDVGEAEAGAVGIDEALVAEGLGDAGDVEGGGFAGGCEGRVRGEELVIDGDPVGGEGFVGENLTV